MRSRLTLAVLLLVGLVVPVGSAWAAACVPAGGASFGFMPHSEGAFTFSGKGWGHGVGMSQYGADGAGAAGCDYRQILTTYYTGVRVGDRDGAGGSHIRVGLFPDSPGGGPQQGVRIANRSGGDVRWGHDGRVWRQPPDAVWTVRTRNDGSIAVRDARGDVPAAGLGSLGGEGSLLTVRLANSVELPQTGRRYRHGRFELRSRGSAGLSLAVRVALERYLDGIREVPASFHPQAQRAQAVAARAYAVRAMQSDLRGNCTCHLYDSVWSQVYTGTTHESAVWEEAVDATRGEVLWYEGAIVPAFYASSHGGHSESAAFVWGSGSGYDYLRAVDDSRWDRASANPYRRWREDLSAQVVTTRLERYPRIRLQVGTVVDLRVTSRGRSGRAGAVVVTGTRGQATVPGGDLRSALGLRSTLFQVRSNIGGTPVTGDWDGDGTDGLGWFRDGQWALRSDDGDVTRFGFGRTGDIPVSGDWDGDGMDTIGVFRGGRWYLRNVNQAGPHHVDFRYGREGDIPIVGDWVGDERDTPGLVRPSGTWHLKNALGGGRAWATFSYGRVGRTDRPVVGDWDGDGVTAIGVVRGDRWLLRDAIGGGRARWDFRYGRISRGDHPVIGDWDAQGGQSVGIIRDLTWHLRNALAGGPGDESLVFAG